MGVIKGKPDRPTPCRGIGCASDTRRTPTQVRCRSTKLDLVLTHGCFFFCNATRRDAVQVKWQRGMYPVEIDTDQPPALFKMQLFSLTGVPPERQKIMVKGGTLKDDSDWTKVCSTLDTRMAWDRLQRTPLFF